MATAFPTDEGSNTPQKAQESAVISWQKKLEEAKTFKSAGNDKFKEKQYKAAIGKYHRALLYLKGIKQSLEDVPFAANREPVKIPDSSLNEINQITAQVYNNLAACILKSDNPTYRKVIDYCDEVLTGTPLDLKALYRKGVALYMLKCYEDSIASLRKAANQPQGQKDANIRKYLQLCEKGLASQHAEMKETYKAMFKS